MQSGERDRHVAITLACHMCSDGGMHWWVSRKGRRLSSQPRHEEDVREDCPDHVTSELKALAHLKAFQVGGKQGRRQRYENLWCFVGTRM